MLYLFPRNLAIFFSLKSEHRWSQLESLFFWGWDEHEGGGVWSSLQRAQKKQKKEEKEQVAWKIWWTVFSLSGGCKNLKTWVKIKANTKKEKTVFSGIVSTRILLSPSIYSPVAGARYQVPAPDLRTEAITCIGYLVLVQPTCTQCSLEVSCTQFLLRPMVAQVSLLGVFSRSGRVLRDSWISEGLLNQGSPGDIW